jgi:hypothetical protein
MRAVALAQGPNGETLTSLLKKNCPSGNSIASLPQAELEKYLTPEEATIVRRHRQLRDTPITILNLNASIGYKKFSYLNPVDFSELSRKTVPFAVSAALGFNRRASAPFFGFGYEYKRDYKAADERVLCPAPAAPPPTECKSSEFDAPNENIDHTAFALVRTANLFGIPALMSRKARQDDAVDPAAQDRKFMPVVEFKAAYDVKDKTFSFAAPIYFFLDNDKQFKGGFRTAWQQGRGTEPDRLKFSFFVVKSFDFFGL